MRAGVQAGTGEGSNNSQELVESRACSEIQGSGGGPTAPLLCGHTPQAFVERGK